MTCEEQPGPEGAAHPAMSLECVSRRFGTLKALDELSFDIGTGEILGIAGPNGAGKTTLLNVCTGVLAASSGRVRFGEHVVSKLAPHQCCQLGIARTFQVPQVFSSLSVEDNVLMGSIFGQGARERVPTGEPRAHDIMEIVGLGRQRRLPASSADLVTRKRIMLAAALASRPKLLFLDEPLSGLNAEEVDMFVDLFKRLHATLKFTLVVVEHKVRALAALSQRILILNFGSILCLDRPEVVLRDPRVIDIYLGTRNLA